MYIGFYSHHPFYNKNGIFEEKNVTLVDTMKRSFLLLKKKLEVLGHRVATIDTDNLEGFNAVVFIEFPGWQNTYLKKLMALGNKNLYLLAYESPLIKPDNLSVQNHKPFKKIFTWADDLVDNKTYIKINYNDDVPKIIDWNTVQRTTLCALISSNKFTRHPKELYTERINTIRWFEKNRPQDFDLYGQGWSRHYFNGKFLGVKLARLNRLKFLTTLLAKHYPSWRGQVPDKISVYKKYRFAICYENIEGYPGYITEKIFDCFFGGCVPVYLGAPNIQNHIPPNTFIDKRNFPTYEQLFQHLSTMPEQMYRDYLQNIQAFIASPAMIPFTPEYFADTLIREVVDLQ